MDDREIISLYNRRDEEAIRETDAEYGKQVYGLSYRILENREDAEENKDDTYLQAWRTIPPTKPVSLLAYLLKICRNYALNRIDWKHAKKRHAEIVELSDELANCIPDNRVEEFSAAETGRLISMFLRRLPAEQGDILLRRCFSLESIPMIAQSYGYSETKVRSILFRTRKQLKEYLESEGIQV